MFVGVSVLFHIKPLFLLTPLRSTPSTPSARADNKKAGVKSPTESRRKQKAQRQRLGLWPPPVCRPCQLCRFPSRQTPPDPTTHSLTIHHHCRFAGLTNHRIITAPNHTNSRNILVRCKVTRFFFTCCSSSLIRHSGRRAAGDKPPFSTADSTPSTPVSPQASSEASTRGVMAAIIPDRSRPWHRQNGSGSKESAYMRDSIRRSSSLGQVASFQSQNSYGPKSVW